MWTSTMLDTLCSQTRASVSHLSLWCFLLLKESDDPMLETFLKHFENTAFFFFFFMWHFKTSWHKMKSDVWSPVCEEPLPVPLPWAQGSQGRDVRADGLRARAGFSERRPRNDQLRRPRWPLRASPAAGSRS